jgi:lysophospholipase L1-like esterase
MRDAALIQPRTLVCFGDSNTHGTLPLTDLGQSDRLCADQRWPGIVRAQLGDDWSVIEEGLPGRTTLHDDPIEGAYKNGALGLEIVLHSHKPNDLLIIMLGTNDLKQRFSKPASDIVISVKKLIELAQGSGSGPQGSKPSILLVCPPRILEAGVLATMFGGGAEKSHDLADGYASVARQMGCAFLDAGEHIASSPIDGVHFGADEHARLGAAIAAKIRDVTV